MRSNHVHCLFFLIGYWLNIFLRLEAEEIELNTHEISTRRNVIVTHAIVLRQKLVLYKYISLNMVEEKK